MWPYPHLMHEKKKIPNFQEIVLKMEESYPRRLGSLLRCGKPSIPIIASHLNLIYLFYFKRVSAHILCKPSVSLCWSLRILLPLSDELHSQSSLHSTAPTGKGSWNIVCPQSPHVTSLHPLSSREDGPWDAQPRKNKHLSRTSFWRRNPLSDDEEEHVYDESNVHCKPRCRWRGWPRCWCSNQCSLNDQEPPPLFLFYFKAWSNMKRAGFIKQIFEHHPLSCLRPNKCPVSQCSHRL